MKQSLNIPRFVFAVAVGLAIFSPENVIAASRSIECGIGYPKGKGLLDQSDVNGLSRRKNRTVTKAGVKDFAYLSFDREDHEKYLSERKLKDSDTPMFFYSATFDDGTFKISMYDDESKVASESITPISPLLDVSSELSLKTGPNTEVFVLKCTTTFHKK